MQLGMKQILGFAVRSTGVTIGRVSDLLLDVPAWRLRYLKIGFGARGGDRLLPMAAAASPDARQRCLPIGLTSAELDGGPAIDLSRPLTRPQELTLHEHYRWTPYWSARTANDAPSLVGLDEMMGFRVDAADGELGRVDDLVAEDDWWSVIHLVVAGPRGPAEVRPDWIGAVDRSARQITLNRTLSQFTGPAQLARA